MKKRKLAFLVGITPNLSFAAGNIAVSLAKYMKCDYELIIYYTDLSDEDIQTFGQISHCRLVPFHLEENFVQTMLKELPQESRFRTRERLMCFCHFEVFSLLKEYENVVWLDADISIQADLSGILDFAPFGITTDKPWLVKDQFTIAPVGYDIDRMGVCTAVMLVNDRLPYQEMYQYCYDTAVQYAENLVNPDQAVINIMLQKFKIEPMLMPIEKWQCISWRDKAITAAIVHFGTEKKVWNDSNILNSFPEWYRTHLEWVRLGGSDFDQTMVKPKNILPKVNFLEEKIKELELNGKNNQ